MEKFEECNLPHILHGLATLKMQSPYITFAKMTYLEMTFSKNRA